MTFLKLRPSMFIFLLFIKNIQINNEKMILPLVWVSVLMYVNFGGRGATTNSHKLNDSTEHKFIISHLHRSGIWVGLGSFSAVGLTG